jgi:hypothetical protein
MDRKDGAGPRIRTRAGKDHQGMRGNENLDGWFLPIIIIVFQRDRVKDDGGTDRSFALRAVPISVRNIPEAGERGRHP